MRRLAVLFSGVLSVGALAAAAPLAQAATDWTVNGQPLAPGQEVAVKFATISPVQLTVPELGLHVTCASWKGKGTIVGGVTGTGELVNPKFSKCIDTESGKTTVVKIKVGPIGVRTDEARVVGTPYTIEFIVNEALFKKGGRELAMAGVVDSYGPKPEAGNLLEFPTPPLSATTLTVGGDPAELVAQATLTLPKHAVLSQAEP
jgi:hypothetical protein